MRCSARSSRITNNAVRFVIGLDPRPPPSPPLPGTRTFEDIRANGGVAWKPGDAFLSPYDGDYVGVGYVPAVTTRNLDLGSADGHADGDDDDDDDDDEPGALPAQYAYLPLDLF